MGWFDKQSKRNPNNFKGYNPIEGDKMRENSSVPSNYNKFPEHHIDLVIPLITKIANERKNHLETMPLFGDSQYPESQTKTKEILKNSGFTKLRRALGLKLFYDGSAYMAEVPYNGSYILDLWTVVDHNQIGNILTEIECMTSTMIVVNDVEVPLQATIKYDSSKGATLTYWYTATTLDENGEEVLGNFQYSDVHTYRTPEGKPVSKIPGWIFKANEKGLPELTYANILPLQEYLKWAGQEIPEEGMKTKTWFSLNSNFTDQTVEQHEELLRSGKSTLTSESFNQKLQEGLGIIITGSQATTFSQLQFTFLEDKFKEYIGALRDTTGTSAQKNDLQVSSLNAFATDTLLSMKALRQEDYERFFEGLSELTGEEVPTLEVKLSPTEQAKMDMLDAKIAQLKAQAEKTKNSNFGGK